MRFETPGDPDSARTGDIHGRSNCCSSTDREINHPIFSANRLNPHLAYTKQTLFKALLRFSVCLALLFWTTAGTAAGADRPKIIVGGDHDNPPYEYLENGKPTGFNVELIQATAAVLGLDIEVRLGPWNQARKDLELGNIDALAGMYYSMERRRSVNFSVAHTIVTPALFVRQDSPIRSLEDIQGKEIIVQEGDFLHDFLKKDDRASRIITVTDPTEELTLLVSGKHDGAFMPSRLQGEYLIKKLKLSGLKIITIDLPPLRYCFAVTKDNPELRYKLDEGLNMLRETGRYREIYEKWFGVFEKKVWWETIKYFVLALTLIALLFAISLLWSWSLKRQVRIQIAELRASEEQLRQAHAELEQRVEARTADLAKTNARLKAEISERAKIEAVLRASEEKYRTLVDNVDIGVFQSTVSHPGRLLQANLAMSKLTGYTHDELMQLSILDVYQDPNARILLMEELKTKGFVKNRDVMMKKKDGTPVWASLTISVQFDEQGSVKWLNGVGEDITDRKRTEELLTQKTAELERSNKELELFASIASHDLKAPLSTIGGFAQLLHERYKDKLDEKAQRALTHIVNGTQNMDALITDLLIYARVTSDGRSFGPVSCTSAVETALANLHADIEKNGAIITCDNLPVLHGDEVQFVQLFQNLIGNAIKYRSEQSPRIQVTAKPIADCGLQNAECEAEPEIRNPKSEFKPGWLFSVKDNGIGIHQAHFDDIFKIFKRLHHDKHSGTGLGLAVCKKIVERHGGSIWVGSEQGTGSTFYFTIPDRSA